jgi:hypothetical protein
VAKQNGRYPRPNTASHGRRHLSQGLEHWTMVGCDREEKSFATWALARAKEFLKPYLAGQLHPLHHLDAQQVEAALQRARGEVAQ